MQRSWRLSLDSFLIACNPHQLLLPKAIYPSTTSNACGGEDRTFNSLNNTIYSLQRCLFKEVTSNNCVTCYNFLWGDHSPITRAQATDKPAYVLGLKPQRYGTRVLLCHHVKLSLFPPGNPSLHLLRLGCEMVQTIVRVSSPVSVQQH